MRNRSTLLFMCLIFGIFNKAIALDLARAMSDKECLSAKGSYEYSTKKCVLPQGNSTELFGFKNFQALLDFLSENNFSAFSDLPNKDCPNGFKGKKELGVNRQQGLFTWSCEMGKFPNNSLLYIEANKRTHLLPANRRVARVAFSWSKEGVSCSKEILKSFIGNLERWTLSEDFSDSEEKRYQYSLKFTGNTQRIRCSDDPILRNQFMYDAIAHDYSTYEISPSFAAPKK